MTPAALTLAWSRVRIETRQPLGYALRIWTGIAMLAVLLETIATSGGRGAPGLGMLEAVYGVDLLALAALAAFGFATTITDEREQRTLPLLELAGFRPVAILVGKTSATLVTVATLLLVQLPFVLLAVALGGVSTGHVLAAFAVLGAFALFAAAVGTCASAWLASGRTATVATALALLAATSGHALLESLGPLVAGTALGPPADALASWLAGVSAAGSFGALGRGAAPDVVAPHLVAAAALFGLAALRARRSWATAERGDERAARRRAPLRGDALVWKDVEFHVGGRRGIALRALGYAALAVVTIQMDGGYRGVDTVRSFAVATFWVVTVDLSVFAVRALRQEVTERTLPLLITASHDTDRILWAKFRAGGRAALPAVLALGVATICEPGAILTSPDAAVGVLGVAGAAMVAVTLAMLVGRVALGLGDLRVAIATVSFAVFVGPVLVGAVVIGIGGGGMLCCAFGFPVLLLLGPFLLAYWTSARLAALGGEL